MLGDAVGAVVGAIVSGVGTVIGCAATAAVGCAISVVGFGALSGAVGSATKAAIDGDTQSKSWDDVLGDAAAAAATGLAGFGLDTFIYPRITEEAG